MSAACPGWTVIRSPDELEEHDHADPAYFLIPAAKVRTLGAWLFALEQPGVVGNLSRYIYGLMTSQARALTPNTDPLTYGADDTPIPTGDGEEPQDELYGKLNRTEIDDPPIPTGDGEEPEDELYDLLTRTGIVDTE